MNQMMKQVQKFTEDTQRTEEELASERIEVSSGGGVVTAIVNGMERWIDSTMRKAAAPAASGAMR